LEGLGDLLQLQQGQTRKSACIVRIGITLKCSQRKFVMFPCICQVWFADDATAGGTLLGLREWWSKIQSLGPAYWYYIGCFTITYYFLVSFSQPRGVRTIQERLHWPDMEYLNI